MQDAIRDALPGALIPPANRFPSRPLPLLLHACSILNRHARELRPLPRNLQSNVDATAISPFSPIRDPSPVFFSRLCIRSAFKIVRRMISITLDARYTRVRSSGILMGFLWRRPNAKHRARSIEYSIHEFLYPFFIITYVTPGKSARRSNTDGLFEATIDRSNVQVPLRRWPVTRNI